MAKNEIRERARFVYADELQYAIARDDKVDLTQLRARAAMRLGREYEGRDISGVWSGYIEGIARQEERGFEVDMSSGQLKLSGALRVGDLTLVPCPRARARDWLAVDERHENKYQEHRGARDREREAIHGIVNRLYAYGGDPMTLEACPDLFAEKESEAA